MPSRKAPKLKKKATGVVRKPATRFKNPTRAHLAVKGQDVDSTAGPVVPDLGPYLGPLRLPKSERSDASRLRAPKPGSKTRSKSKSPPSEHTQPVVGQQTNGQAGALLQPVPDCDEAVEQGWFGICSPVPHPLCLEEPVFVKFRDHPRTTCDDCRNRLMDGNVAPITLGCRELVHNYFTGRVYEQMGNPRRWTFRDGFHMVPADPSIRWDRMQAFLCQYCEDDEILHWRRRKDNPVYLALDPSPATAAAGIDNECICADAVLSPHYCSECILDGADVRLRVGEDNGEWLATIARDQNGRRVTASYAMQAHRVQTNRALACRCGRDARRPTLRPRATFCLVCEGVMIHIANNTGPASRIRVNWRRLLTNLKANYPLEFNGGQRLDNVVGRNNNSA